MLFMGRIVFGGSAMLSGMIALMWHDAGTWQTPYPILKMPLGTIIGDILMVAQVTGGAAILFAGTVRWGAILLAVVYALFSLAAIPGIIAAPRSYVQYGSFFEQFSPACGALALYAVTARNTLRPSTTGEFARVGFGLCVVSFALSQMFYPALTASLVPRWIPPNQMFWEILTTAAFALAAIAILVNYQARLALQLLTLMLAFFGLLIWLPALIAHPSSHFTWSEFALNFLITGAAWMVADLSATSASTQSRLTSRHSST